MSIRAKEKNIFKFLLVSSIFGLSNPSLENSTHGTAVNLKPNCRPGLIVLTLSQRIQNQTLLELSHLLTKTSFAGDRRFFPELEIRGLQKYPKLLRRDLAL